jgi:hypothetical protein
VVCIQVNNLKRGGDSGGEGSARILVTKGELLSDRNEKLPSIGEAGRGLSSDCFVLEEG